MRFYSIIQINMASPYKIQSPHDWRIVDDWEDIPLPSSPEHYSEPNIKIESISTASVSLDFTKPDELRLSLPAELDNAMLYDCLRNSDYIGKIWIQNFVMVWDISSDS